jgi:hypothetical protein
LSSPSCKSSSFGRAAAAVVVDGADFAAAVVRCYGGGARGLLPGCSRAL